MKIIHNKYIPFKGFLAINLFGILFVRSDARRSLNEIDINHEAIHTAQMREMLYIGFYIWYFIEWTIRLIMTFDSHESYRRLSFEVEAYSNEKNLTYLTNRKHFNWMKLL